MVLVFIIAISVAALAVGSVYLLVDDSGGEILHLFPSISFLGASLMLFDFPSVEDSFTRDSFSVPEALMTRPRPAFFLVVLQIGILIPQFMFGDEITAAMQTVAVMTVLVGSHPRISRPNVETTGCSSLRTVVATPTVGNSTDGLFFSTEKKLCACRVTGSQFPSRTLWSEKLDRVRALAKDRNIVAFVKEYKRIVMNMLENDIKGMVHDRSLDNWKDAFHQLAMADRFMMTESENNRRPAPCQNLWYMLGVLERASWRSGVSLRKFEPSDGQPEELWNMMRGLNMHFGKPETFDVMNVTGQVRSMAELFYAKAESTEMHHARGLDRMERGIPEDDEPWIGRPSSDFDDSTVVTKNSSTSLLSSESLLASLDSSRHHSGTPGVGDTTTYLSSTSDPIMASSSTAKSAGVQTEEGQNDFEPVTSMITVDIGQQKESDLLAGNESHEKGLVASGHHDSLGDQSLPFAPEPGTGVKHSVNVSKRDPPLEATTTQRLKTIQEPTEEDTSLKEGVGKLRNRHVNAKDNDPPTPTPEPVPIDDTPDKTPRGWFGRLFRPHSKDEPKTSEAAKADSDALSETENILESVLKEADLVQEMREKYNDWFDNAIRQETAHNQAFPQEMGKALSYINSSWPARMLVLIEYFWTIQESNAGGRFLDPQGTPVSANERYRMQYALLEQCMLVQSAVLIFAASMRILSSL